MTGPTRKALGRSIEKAASERGMRVARLRRYVATIALAQVLHAATDRGIIGGFAIKGGYAIELRFRRARASRDVDVILAAPRQELLERLDAAFAEGWSGFRFSIRRAPDERKHGYRFDLVALYERGEWGTFEVEVMAGAIEGVDLVEARDIEDLGLEMARPIPCLNLYEQISQKLHALTDPDENRPRDMVDIFIVTRLVKLERYRLLECVERVFDERGTHSWPTAIELRQGWYEEIERIIEDNGLPNEVSEIVDGVRSYVDDLFGNN